MVIQTHQRRGLLSQPGFELRHHHLKRKIREGEGGGGSPPGRIFLYSQVCTSVVPYTQLTNQAHNPIHTSIYINCLTAPFAKAYKFINNAHQTTNLAEKQRSWKFSERSSYLNFQNSDSSTNMQSKTKVEAYDNNSIRMKWQNTCNYSKVGSKKNLLTSK
jgi:hypothetical protein